MNDMSYYEVFTRNTYESICKKDEVIVLDPKEEFENFFSIGDKTKRVQIMKCHK